MAHVALLQQESPHPDTLVRDKTKACAQSFQNCLQIFELGDYANDEEEIWIEQKSAEFRWWDSGLNADRKGPGSLDARLALRPDVRDRIVEVLEGLTDALRKYFELSLEAPLHRVTDDQEDHLRSPANHDDPSGAGDIGIKPMSNESGDGYHQATTLDDVDRTPSPWSDMSSSSSSGRSPHNTRAKMETTNEFEAERHEQRIYINTNVEVLLRIHTSIKRSGLKFRNKRADDILRQVEEAFEHLKHEEGDFIALSHPCGEHELFRRYLARLVLGNGYIHDLLQRLDFEGHEERRANQDLPPWRRIVHIVLRSYFYDPARLTIVQKRLVDANVVRRNRMMYAGSLSRSTKRPELQEADLDHDDVPPIQCVSLVPTETAVTVQPAQTTPRSLALPTSQSSAAEKKPVSSYIAQPATELDSVFSITGALMSPRSNRTAATKMSARVGHLDYPKCPAEYGHFPCPYCPNMLSDEYTRRDKWRAHVAQDLCAYVCIFPDCQSPDEMFNSTYEWMSHMARYHAEVEWHCSICARAQPQSQAHIEDTYHDPSHLKRHIVESHQSVEEADLDLLVQSGTRTVGIQQVACPLCRPGLVTLEITEKGDAHRAENGMGLFQLEDDEHIATHIHEFALQAFPSRRGSGSSASSASSSSRSLPDDRGEITFQSLGGLATAEYEPPSLYTWQELEKTIADMIDILEKTDPDMTDPMIAMRLRLAKLTNKFRHEYQGFKDKSHVDATAYRLNKLYALVMRYQEICNMPTHEQRAATMEILADYLAYKDTAHESVKEILEEGANYPTASLSRREGSSVVPQSKNVSSHFPRIKKGRFVPPSDAEKLESLVDARMAATGAKSLEVRLRWALQMLDHVRILSEAPKYDSEVAKLEQRARHFSLEDLLDLQVQAIRIVESSAEQGNPEALYTRSKWFHLGWFGYPIDREKAQVGYKSAAASGFARANYGLGSLIEDRYSDPSERLIALGYFDLGFRLEDAACAYRLGMKLLTGEASRHTDIPRALSRLKVAAESADEESPEGAYIYGMLLARTLPEIVIDDDIYTEIPPSDLKRATAYIYKAAYLGSSKAQLRMGDMYAGAGQKGLYNLAMSIHYWRLAATRGQRSAALRLSELFLARTSVVTGNDQLAFSYALQAAREGDGHAEFIIGYCFETGAAVGKVLLEARTWYELAIQHGFSPAADRLKALSSSYSLDQAPAEDDLGTQNPNMSSNHLHHADRDSLDHSSPSSADNIDHMHDSQPERYRPFATSLRFVTGRLQVLSVTVYGASRIPRRVLSRPQHPYCTVSVGTKIKWTKTDRSGGRNPYWGDGFEFDLDELSPDAPPHVLSVAIRDDGGEKLLIASVNILIVPAMSNTQYYDLFYEGNFAGKIKIDLMIHLRT